MAGGENVIAPCGCRSVCLDSASRCRECGKVVLMDGKPVLVRLREIAAPKPPRKEPHAP